jgi:CDP-diacylglycerol--serine O-phosphatidyltransferase
MKITRAVVPSLFTTLNVFCGFLSILNSHQGRIEMAAWFILLAAVFDTLDGMMARITRTSSQFGVELDSLADVVSFGAAPSFMVYMSGMSAFENWGILISSMPLVFGAIRLARFNSQLVGFEKDYFKGLPIPAQAIALCAFFFDNFGENGLSSWGKVSLVPLTILLSLLMVSTIKYDTIPRPSRRVFAQHPIKMVGFTVATLAVIFSKGQLLFPLTMAFILFGVARAFVGWMRKQATVLEKEEGEETEIQSIDI